MNYLINSSTDPYRNMAFDEYCLEAACPDGPVFYLWRNSPSVIIGLNQDAYAEVNLPYLKEKGIKLARRVTGGGAVYHDLNNLNYSIVGRTSDLGDAKTLVADALKKMGVPAFLSGRNDILVDGKKVSGYARRVWKDRTIVHGTLLFDTDLDTMQAALSTPESKLITSGIASVRSRVGNLKDYLPGIGGIEGFRAALHTILAVDGRELTQEPADVSEIESRRERFASREWIFGRSPRSGMKVSKRLPCGTVSAYLTVSRGILEDIRFEGDFLGGSPSEELAALLTGCRYDPDSLKARLEEADTAKYFDNTDAEALLDLICL